MGVLSPLLMRMENLAGEGMAPVERKNLVADALEEALREESRRHAQLLREGQVILQKKEFLSDYKEPFEKAAKVFRQSPEARKELVMLFQAMAGECHQFMNDVKTPFLYQIIILLENSATYVKQDQERELHTAVHALLSHSFSASNEGFQRMLLTLYKRPEPLEEFLDQRLDGGYGRT